MSKKITLGYCYRLSILLLVAAASLRAEAQDSTAASQNATVAISAPLKKRSYTKNTFYGDRIIDNQTVMVPIKGTLGFEIIHRFGTWNNGASDLFGIFSGANMRLGMTYTPLNNLQVGIGANNNNMVVDADLKYAILKQTRDNHFPVSITYYGNIAMDTRKKSPALPIVKTSDRLTFFNELMVARKITNAFSAQVGISLTHVNNIPGYFDDAGKIHQTMKNDHFAFSASGRYMITAKTAVIVNYDQPLTQHPMNNPHPNLSFGLEMETSGHTFQVFAGNYGYTLPQDNNLLNQNDFTKGQFLIGFNISRLWNF